MNRRVALRTTLAAAVAGSASLSCKALGIRPPSPEGSIASRGTRGPGTPIRLASNENPLGMPASAERAIAREMADGNRYPGQAAAALAEAVAAHHGLVREQVVLGNGSTDVLRMVVQAVAREGGRLILPDPTFEHVERYASPLMREIVKVPLLPDWSHDLDAMRAAAEAPGASLVFICNPNNPTGTLTSCDSVERWIEAAPASVFFLIDEAYFDFVENREANGYRTLLRHIDRPNVLVSRTFSKAYGLAGLRLGYGLARADTIRRVREFSGLSNLNHFAIVAARAAMGEPGFVDRTLEVNRRGREILVSTLDELKIEHLPTQANFVMHRVPGPLQEYNGRMRERGIWVGRAFPPLVQYSRVSIGLPDEMRVVAATLRDFRTSGWI